MMNWKTIATISAATALLLGIIGSRLASDSTPPPQTTAPASMRLSPEDWVKVERRLLQEKSAVQGHLQALHTAALPVQIEAIATQVFVRVGDFVHKNQVLAVFDRRNIALNQRERAAQLQASQAKLALTKQRLERQRQLFQQGFISALAFAEFEADFLQQKAQFDAQQSQLEQSENDLAHSQLRAPFDGIIAERHLEEGQLAAKNSQAFRLLDDRVLVLEASVAARDIEQVKIGQVIEFKAQNQTHRATLQRISPSANSTRSLPIFAHIANDDRRLKVGQFVQADLIFAQKNALALPKSSLRELQGDRAWVLVIDEKTQTLRRQNLQIGISDSQNHWVEISGLPAGARVLPPTVLGVHAGQKVQAPQSQAAVVVKTQTPAPASF